ncbi:MAG TPA: hypothetical protein VEC06_05400 [Paucimonas sp.]|nr:hypothetical protein [Paucimonas sp.]
MEFQDYLNSYRVKAPQAPMHDPLHADTAIPEPGMDAGFNSKSTMNRAFGNIPV